MGKAKEVVIDIFIYGCCAATATIFGLFFCTLILQTDFLAGIFSIFYFRMLFYCLMGCFLVLLISIIISIKAKGKLGFLKNTLNTQGIVSIFLISFLLDFSFVGNFAFTNDRSYTIFFLCELYDNSERVYTQPELEQVFIERFVIEGNAAGKRLDEQMSTGFIEEVEGGYRISDAGKNYVEFNRFIDIFLPAPSDPSSLYPNGKDFVPQHAR